MIEALGPLVSLFRLFLDGLSRATQVKSSSYKRSVQRKILKLQLSLEDIIDNAQQILVTIFPPNNLQQPFDEDALRKFRHLVYVQLRAIGAISDQLHDDSLEEMMKVFAPELRRRITELIHIKGGALRDLQEVLWEYSEVRPRGVELFVDANPAVLEWNHDRFVDEGASYARRVFRQDQSAEISLLDRFIEQETVVKELLDCSDRLSKFISENIDLNTAIGLRRQ